MKIHTFIVSLFLAITVTACGQTSNTDQVKTKQVKEHVSNPAVINVDEFKTKMNLPNAQLIDVRTDGEVAEGIIPNASHMDVMEWDSFVESTKSLDPDKPVLLYCKSGVRSNNAANYLSENGFKEVYDLKGGIVSWRKKGEEIVKP